MEIHSLNYLPYTRQTLTALATGTTYTIALRQFEKRLLDIIGYGLPLESIIQNDTPANWYQFLSRTWLLLVMAATQMPYRIRLHKTYTTIISQMTKRLKPVKDYYRVRYARYLRVIISIHVCF